MKKANGSVLRLSVGVLFSLFMAISTSMGQYAVDDAPTRRGIGGRIPGTLEGVILEKKTGITPDAKDITITFILSEEPAAFFDYYDEERKAIIIDLYDMRIGESPLDSIVEHPISGSKIENVQVDLNKDVAGLRPDLREVVRVTFHSKYNFEYEIMEEFGVISLTFHWDRKIERKLNRAKTAIYWKVPLAVIVTSGAGFATWWYGFREDPQKDPCPVCPVGNPPAFPRD